MADGKQPELKMRDGNLSVAGFINEAKVGKETRRFMSVTVQRSYRDKDDNWQNTSSVNLNDLPRLAILLQAAYLEGRKALAEEMPENEGGK